MAKNDYHVIVYQILSYLYQMLKNGKKVEGKYISYDNKYFQINKNYWTYIMMFAVGVKSYPLQTELL